MPLRQTSILHQFIFSLHFLLIKLFPVLLYLLLFQLQVSHRIGIYAALRLRILARTDFRTMITLFLPNHYQNFLNQFPAIFSRMLLKYSKRLNLTQVLIKLYIVMSQEKVQPLVLIYYNIRGKLQPIRNLIAYLELPYVELHIQEKNERKVLSQQIRTVLRDTPIDSSRLPLLVHEGLKVYDSYPIMAYICRRFGREDLLGRTLQQRARLLEILAIYFPKQPTNMSELLLLADRCAGRNQSEQLQIKSATYSSLIKVSGYTLECCLYLMRQPPRSYILGDLTLIDFAFLETSHYVVGFFGDLDIRLSLRISTKEILTPDPEELLCLTTMRDYLTFMRSQPFYQRHREALQSKSIISFLFTEERVAAIRSLWTGDASMVK